VLSWGGEHPCCTCQGRGRPGRAPDTAGGSIFSVRDGDARPLELGMLVLQRWICSSFRDGDTHPSEMGMHVLWSWGCSSSRYWDARPSEVEMLVLQRWGCTSSRDGDARPLEMGMLVLQRLGCSSFRGGDARPSEVGMLVLQSPSLTLGFPTVTSAAGAGSWVVDGSQGDGWTSAGSVTPS